MFARRNFFSTMRRDRILIKLAIISLFFAACYLSKYSAPRGVQLWRNLARNEELYDGDIKMGNVGATTTWTNCRRILSFPRTPALAASSQLTSKIGEVIRSIQRAAFLSSNNKQHPQNLVAISGLPDTPVFIDNLLDSYERALRDNGFSVDIIPSNDNMKKTIKRAVSTSNFTLEDKYVAIFCLHGRCGNLATSPTVPVKTNCINGFDVTLKALNEGTVCNLGEESGAFFCFREGVNSSSKIATATDLATTLTTSWVVTQQGVPTFATVLNESLPQFFAELQKASFVSAKRFSAPAFTILQRPVRLSLFVLAVGDAPTAFYLHQEGVVRISSFVNFAIHQEHETELVWNFAQFRKYIHDFKSPKTAAEFFRKVRNVVTNVFQNAPGQKKSGEFCRDFYQMLEVTVFVSDSLDPIVVTVADQAQLPNLQFPNKILENAIALLLDRSPLDSESADFFEKYMTAAFETTEIKNFCDLPKKLSCVGQSQLKLLTEIGVFKLKAQNFGFEFIGIKSDENDVILRKTAEFAFPCVTEDFDYNNEITNEEISKEIGLSSLTGPGPGPGLDKRCQYDSIFRSLMLVAKTYPNLELQPNFHPLITSYEIRVPFDVTSIEMEFIPADCATEITLAGETVALNNRRESFTVGVGENLLSVNVVKRTQTGHVTFRTYTFKLLRPSREGINVALVSTGDDSLLRKCFWRQTCDLQLYPDEPCGLQPESTKNGRKFQQMNTECPGSVGFDQKERWILPCQDCQNESNCDWNKAVWSPDECAGNDLDRKEVQRCLQNKKVIFIGDSTNRGIMAYMMEQFNGTLWEDEKIHSVKSYDNLNGGNTTFSFAYYPQFWLPPTQRPSFIKAFHHVVKASEPLQNNTETVFIVGGLQFMRSSHLRELQKSLKRAKLEGSRVIIKTLGSGFFVLAKGIRHVSSEAIFKLQEINQEIIQQSQQLGFHVVDTFAMTSSRYNEFRAGKCSCHFHSVEQNPVVPGANQKTFSVHGPINAQYSQSVLRAICSN